MLRLAPANCFNRMVVFDHRKTSDVPIEQNSTQRRDKLTTFFFSFPTAPTLLSRSLFTVCLRDEGNRRCRWRGPRRHYATRGKRGSKRKEKKETEEKKIGRNPEGRGVCVNNNKPSPTHTVQHSPRPSFFFSFSEVLRCNSFGLQY